MKIYLIADQVTVWGAGKTIDDAIIDAAQYLDDPNNTKNGVTTINGTTPDAVKGMLISERESKNGESGVYIIEYESDWPEKADSMDGDTWLMHYWESQEDE